MAAPASLDGLEPKHLNKVLARHLVVLGGTVQTYVAGGVQVDHFLFSGFILESHGHWFFMTAGHCIDGLGQRMKSNSCHVGDLRLYDHFGLDAKSDTSIPIQFDIDDIPFVDEDGLDFAAIHLPENTRQLLTANGVLPVARRNWEGLRGAQLDTFFVLGLPCQSQLARRGRDEVRVAFAVTTVRIEYDEELNKLENQSTRFRRFVGRLPAELPLRSLKGMSGGPIFGMSAGDLGRGYQIVAMQVSEDRGKGLIYGCPIEAFAGIMDRVVERALRRVGERCLT